MIGTYVNGNTIVAMYEDGTKVRYIKDREKPVPEFPESIDLKITNRCNLGCPMCAEQSSSDGKHADLTDPLLDSLKPYTELAIGGGNPLEHLGLEAFLLRMRDKKVICNLTVNAVHFMRNVNLLGNYVVSGLIHGLGVSVPTEIPDGLIEKLIKFPNAVAHTIGGITPWNVYKQLADHDLNLLVLGYKAKGNGFQYFEDHMGEVNRNYHDLKHNLLRLKDHFRAVAFDNLAVEQFSLRELLTQDEFDQLYMGDDGEFTMYIDLVSGKYGKSSTHELQDIDESTINDLFKKLRG